MEFTNFTHLTLRGSFRAAEMLFYHNGVKFSCWATFFMLMASSEVFCQKRPPISMSSRSKDPEQSLPPSAPLSLKNGAHLDERCSPSNICISTITCPDVLHLLKKAAAKPQLREETISLVRKRICGENFQRRVCCPASSLGYFNNIIHTKGALKSHYTYDRILHLGGNLFALSNSTLLIRDLTYDGLGPDAFFLAGGVYQISF